MSSNPLKLCTCVFQNCKYFQSGLWIGKTKTKELEFCTKQKNESNVFHQLCPLKTSMISGFFLHFVTLQSACNVTWKVTQRHRRDSAIGKPFPHTEHLTPDVRHLMFCLICIVALCSQWLQETFCRQWVSERWLLSSRRLLKDFALVFRFLCSASSAWIKIEQGNVGLISDHVDYQENVGRISNYARGCPLEFCEAVMYIISMYFVAV